MPELEFKHSVNYDTQFVRFELHSDQELPDKIDCVIEGNKEFPVVAKRSLKTRGFSIYEINILRIHPHFLDQNSTLFLSDHNIRVPFDFRIMRVMNMGLEDEWQGDLHRSLGLKDSGLVEYDVIEPSSKFTYQRDGETVEAQTPQMVRCILENCRVVLPWGNVLTADGNCVAQSPISSMRTHFVFRTDTYARIQNLPEVGRVKDAFHYVDASQCLYYHWLCNNIGRAIMVDHNINKPLLSIQPLPAYQRLDEFFEVTMPKHIVHAKLSAPVCVHVNRLELVNAPSTAEGNAQKLLDAMRDHPISGRPLGYGKKIFVSRERLHGARSLHSYDDINNFLECRGFDIVHPQELSTADQISVFRNADIIVAEVGGALANLVFRGYGGVLVGIHPSMTGWRHREHDMWNVLAHQKGMRYFEIPASYVSNRAYHVEIGLLEAALDRI